jgi:hypothetical protein
MEQPVRGLVQLHSVINTPVRKSSIEMYKVILNIFVILIPAMTLAQNTVIYECHNLYIQYTPDRDVKLSMQYKEQLENSWKPFCEGHFLVSKLKQIDGIFYCSEEQVWESRFNSKIMVAKERQFQCAKNNVVPCSDSIGSNRACLKTLGSDESKIITSRADAFELLECSFYGDLVDVPQYEQRENEGKWKSIEFPNFYPDPTYNSIVMGYWRDFPFYYDFIYEDTDEFISVYQDFIFGNIKTDYHQHYGQKKIVSFDPRLRKYSTLTYPYDDKTKTFSKSTQKSLSYADMCSVFE